MDWGNPINAINQLVTSLVTGVGGLGGFFSGSQTPTMAPAQLDPLQVAYQPGGTNPPPYMTGYTNPQVPGMAPSMMGAQPAQYTPGPEAAPSNPNQIPMPNKPDPYLSAIAGASPILMEAMRLRAIRPPTYLSRTYNIPASQPMSVGATVQQPARRLSPLERYQMMLAGMR